MKLTKKTIVAAILFSMPWFAQATITSELTVGPFGSQVTELQTTLTTLGYYKGGITGYFGPVTQTAVIKFQKANGISPAVGYFGPLTLAKLKSGASIPSNLAVGASTPAPFPNPKNTIKKDELDIISSQSSFSAPQPVGTKFHGPWEDPSLHCAPYNLIAVSQSDADVIYIASSYSRNNCGVYKSSDGGMSWKPVNGSGKLKLYAFPGGKYYVPITAISIAPSNSDLIYAGTSEAGNGSIFKSTDGGKSWINVSGGRALGLFARKISGMVNSIAIDQKNPDIVYIGVAENIGPGLVGKIYKSSDGGINWKKIYSGGVTDVFFIVTDPSNSNVIYAYTQNIIKAELEIGSLGGIQYAGTWSYLYRSVDQGNTWNTVPLESSAVITDVALDPFNNNILYISTHPGVLVFILPISSGKDDILKSTNGGKNWSPLNTNLLPTAIATDPSIPDRLYVASVNPPGIFYSRVGKEWKQLNTQNDIQLPSLLFPQHIYLNSAKRVLYAPTSDGIYVIKLDQDVGTTPSPTLQSIDVSLSASPSSVIAGQNVSLTADVSGTAKGTIRYQFDCTNNGGYEVDVRNNTNPYTTTSCSYSSPGTYTARVRVKWGTASSPAEKTVSITVTALMSPTPPTVCVPSWQCNNWNICSSGQQSRTCTDSNNCGVSTNKPPLTQSCAVVCTQEYDPVCGIDGKTYSNKCAAVWQHKVEVKHKGACDATPPPPSPSQGELSMNSSITVMKGDTVEQIISVIIPAWNTDTFTFTAREMPPYINHDFTPRNCKTSCTTTLKIDVAAPYTPTGSYKVTVGTANGINITSSFELKIIDRTSPSMPTVQQATPISSSQIKIGWEDTAATSDSLVIERKMEKDNDYKQIHEELKRNLSSYVDSHLNPNTAYCYRIYFFNTYTRSFKPNYSKEQCATTLQDIPPIPQGKPDLVITSLRAPTTASVGNGTPVLQNVSLTMANNGPVSAGKFRVEFYWSRDDIITADDIPAVSYFIPNSLGPRESKTNSELGYGDVNIPSSLSPGAYYLGAIIDNLGEVEESDETNNTLVADTGKIILSGPPQPPRLISPDNEATFIYSVDGYITYRWNSATEWDELNVFDGPNCLGAARANNSSQSSQNHEYRQRILPAGKTYSWQVKARAYGGVSSAPSECRSFSVQAEEKPLPPSHLSAVVKQGEKDYLVPPSIIL